MLLPDSKRPFGLRWRSNTVFIIASVVIGLLSDTFLYCLFVPILPYMLEQRAGVSPDQVQANTSLLLAVYAGASVVFAPFAGIIADRSRTRQVPFLSGIAVLLAATILLALAEHVWLMALARFLQGTSAAVVWSVGLALCLDTVGQANLGKTLGTAFVFVSAGPVLGPVLGGILYEKSGYFGVFGLASGVLVADLVMRLLVIEKKVAARYAKMSEPSGDPDGSSDDAENGAHTANHSERAPLLRRIPTEHFRLSSDRYKILEYYPILYCFQSPGVLAAHFIIFTQAFVFGTFDATVPTTAQEYFGFTPLHAGLLFIPTAVTDVFIGPLTGWAVDRWGTKPAAVLGSLILVPALTLTRLVQPGGLDQIILYCGLLGACGVGVTMLSSPPFVEASAIVERYHKANSELFGENGPYASLYAAGSIFFNLGLTLGPLASGSLKDSIGYGNMNAVVAVLCGIAAIISFLHMGRMPECLIRLWESDPEEDNGHE